MVKKTLTVLCVVFLCAAAVADISPPDIWVGLDNDYYSGVAEQFGDRVSIWDIELNPAGLFGARRADGFLLPFTLSAVPAGCQIEIELPQSFIPDPERDYFLTIHYGFSGDFRMKDPVVYRLRHPGSEGHLVKVSGAEYSVALTAEELAVSNHLTIDVGGFIERREGDSTITLVFQLYLLVAVTADQPGELGELFATLREYPYTGRHIELKRVD